MSNPFSSRFLQLGEIPLFMDFGQSDSDQQDAYSSIFLRALSCQFWGMAAGRKSATTAQIIGPHGTGKSTFLTFLAALWTEQGKSVFPTVLQDKQRTFSEEFWEELTEQLTKLTTGSSKMDKKKNLFELRRRFVVIVDGYEQLGWSERFKLARLRRQFPFPLLLTAHKPIWFVPILHETAPSFFVLQQVVRHLLRDSSWSISEKELRELHKRFRGNSRAVLAELYDRYEST